MPAMPSGGWTVGSVVDTTGSALGNIAILECFANGKPLSSPQWNLYFSG